MSPSPATTVRDRAALLDLLAARAYRHGSFTLASGRASTHYVNCKPVSLSGAGLALLGAQLLAEVEEQAVAVAGLTLGADPLVSAVVLQAALNGRCLDALIVRKEAKGHGTGAWLEGPLPPVGSRITVLEDVVTTGGSSLRAVAQLRDAGYVVERVVAIVDRQEGGRQAMTVAGLDLRSLFLLKDVAAAAARADGNPWSWRPEATSLLQRPVSLLRLEGEDTLRVLHGQTSQAVASAQAGQWLSTCCITPTGRMRALADVLVDEGGAWLVIDSGDAAEVREALDRVLFPADRVRLGPLQEATRLTPVKGLTGDSGNGPTNPAGEWSLLGEGLGWRLGREVLLPAGAPVPPDLASLRPLSPMEQERWRIARGRPAAPNEINDDTNPFELGLSDRVSLSKGCYVGQETLARLATYGGVKQQLRRWSCAGAGDPGLLGGGAVLQTTEGLRAGVITSAIRLEDEGCWIGLALVRRQALEEPVLRSGEGASVAELRLSVADDFMPPPVGIAGAA